MSVIIDASALLAFAFREAGWRVVDRELSDACMSAVNAAEFISRYVGAGALVDEAARLLDDLVIDVAPFDRELAVMTGVLHRATRPHGLALADCACLALARRDRSPVLTADRAWARLEIDVDVRLIRP